MRLQRYIIHIHHVQLADLELTAWKIGAGIQIPSNSSRILLKWGLEPFLKGKVVEPQGMTFRRWENGEPIGHTKLIPEFRNNFDAPYYVVHRADFHEALHKLAQQHGVCLDVNCKVAKYDANEGKVTTLDGRVFYGDLVVGADGIFHSDPNVYLSLIRPQGLNRWPDPRYSVVTIMSLT
jgi:salicylate hydroxylase